MTEQKLKHLEFIQNVITRMNTISFAIKGWTVTLASALYGLAAKDADSRFVFVAYFALPAFWALDAFYLSQERQYRALYDVVRHKDSTDFSMDASQHDCGRNTWFSCARSKTIVGLYPVAMVVGAAAILWQIWHTSGL